MPRGARGLASLLEEQSGGGDGITDIQLDKIDPNPLQPRKHFNDETVKELAASIKEQGLLQPIMVRLTESGRYQIILGERRFRAIKSLGWVTIPCIVKNLEDEQVLVVSLIENIQREDVTFWDQAMAVKGLKNLGHDVDKVATLLGKSKRWVYRVLQIFNTPERVQELVRDEKINGWVATELTTLSVNGETEENIVAIAEALAENPSLLSFVKATIKRAQEANIALTIHQSLPQDQWGEEGSLTAPAELAAEKKPTAAKSTPVSTQTYVVDTELLENAKRYQDNLTNLWEWPVHVFLLPDGSGEVRYKFKTPDALEKIVEVLSDNSPHQQDPVSDRDVEITDLVIEEAEENEFPDDDDF